MTDGTVRFGVLCSMFQAMLRDRSSAKKRKRLRTFLDRVYTGREYFSGVRLILPSLDRERGTYGLKESALAACLVDAMGISRDSEDALRLVNWRKGGARAGANAGNFALVAAEVLQRRQGMASGGLTIKEVNDALDVLASKENKGDKASILSGLIKKTNAVEMKWILMIILKDLKLGISEKSIFHEFHPDAEDLFNVTCDLKLVCEKLKDRTQRHKRQDIEVGKAVRPQLAMRVSDATTAWKKLHGRQVVVECKFDGDRIQIHKNGADIHYFSRNFLDHSEYAHGMSDVLLQNILADRCILDGEMLVWDTSTQRFADFGSNQEIAKAAREGFESDRQLCYFAFDILYAGDTSVIHQSLAERHDLLRKVVRPVKGRLEILVPGGGINDLCPRGEPCWSIIAYNLEDVESFFKQTIENRDEGIVLKDLSSKWQPSDRSGKWLKLKPDYIHAGADLDVLIIGGYFGSGRRGGEVAQFLMGLAEPSDLAAYPKRFISFCRVGTGLSDDELDSLVNKLKPYFRKNEYPKKAPRFFEVTNNSKERPDVWIESPDKSIILSITSDIRTIKSEVFSSPYSLRFPRISCIRYDKPWHECLDVQSFVDLVHQSNGSMQRDRDNDGLKGEDPKCLKALRKGERRTFSVVQTHLIQTDVSGIMGDTHIFTNMMFYFANIPPSYSLDYFHKLVAENGGMFSMNLNGSVTHCIAAEKKGIKYQAATHHGDVIHYSWFLDCCNQKHLLHLQPKYFLFVTDLSKIKFQEKMDVFSDYYYWDLDISDIKQLFSNMKGSNDLTAINYYRKKYCPKEKWCSFQNCCIYFVEPVSSPNVDHKMLSQLTLRRMKVEVAMLGAEVVSNLSHATHVVAYSALNSTGDFEDIYKNCSSSERNILLGKSLHVVRHHWLEESFEKGSKLPEDLYNLRPDTFKGFEREQWVESMEVPVTNNDQEQQTRSCSPASSDKRKRSRPSSRNPAKKVTVAKPAKRSRPRISRRRAVIDPDETVKNASSDKDFLALWGTDGEDEEHENIDPEKTLEYAKSPVGETKEMPDFMHAITQPKGDVVFEGDRKVDLFDKNHGVDEANKSTVEMLKLGFDPVHAMLLDMVPFLSQKKESGMSPRPDEKPETTVYAHPDEKPERGLNLNPVKNASSDKDFLALWGTGGEDEEHENIEPEKTLEYAKSPVGETKETPDFMHAVTQPKVDFVFEGDRKVDLFDKNHDVDEANKSTAERLELRFDPVHAMLLDIVPSLSQKKKESGMSPQPDGKPETRVYAHPDEKPERGLNSNPVKKKVSYKDVAGALLKDW